MEMGIGMETGVGRGQDPRLGALGLVQSFAIELRIRLSIKVLIKTPGLIAVSAWWVAAKGTSYQPLIATPAGIPDDILRNEFINLFSGPKPLEIHLIWRTLHIVFMPKTSRPLSGGMTHSSRGRSIPWPWQTATAVGPASYPINQFPPFGYVTRLGKYLHINYTA